MTEKVECRQHRDDDPLVKYMTKNNIKKMKSGDLVFSKLTVIERREISLKRYQDTMMRYVQECYEMRRQNSSFSRIILDGLTGKNLGTCWLENLVREE